jgi:hypothetical protein
MKKSRSSIISKSSSKVTSSPSSVQQAKRRKLALEKKAEWNTYLTDANRFRVTDEEIMKKKLLLVSKHNILSDQYQPPKIKSKGKTLKASKLLQEDENDDDDDHSEASEGRSKSRRGRKSSVDNGTSSLDLLELDSQSEEEDERQTPLRSITKKRNHQTIADTSKSSNSNNGSNIFEDIISSSFQSPNNGIDRIAKNKPVKYHSMKNINSAKKASKQQKQYSSLFNDNDKIPEDELTNMTQEIRMLIEELQYYEELSGKKSILQSTVRQENHCFAFNLKFVYLISVLLLLFFYRNLKDY